MALGNVNKAIGNLSSFAGAVIGVVNPIASAAIGLYSLVTSIISGIGGTPRGEYQRFLAVTYPNMLSRAKQVNQPVLCIWFDDEILMVMPNEQYGVVYSFNDKVLDLTGRMPGYRIQGVADERNPGRTTVGSRQYIDIDTGDNLMQQICNGMGTPISVWRSLSTGTSATYGSNVVYQDFNPSIVHDDSYGHSIGYTIGGTQVDTDGDGEPDTTVGKSDRGLLNIGLISGSLYVLSKLIK